MSIMASNMVRDGSSELEQAFTLFDPPHTPLANNFHGIKEDPRIYAACLRPA